MTFKSLTPRSQCITLNNGACSKVCKRGYPLSQVGIRSTNNCRYSRRFRILLQASSQEGDPEPSATARGLLTTKDQQIPALSVLAVVHTSLAAAATLRPQWSLTNLLGLHPSLLDGATPFAPEAATSLLVAAGSHLWLMVSCLMCLRDAVAHDRLASDTYKRLALGVMYQSVIAAVLFLRNKALCASSQFGGAAGVFLLTAFIAGRIYVAGSGAFSVPVILRSLFGNTKDLFSPKNIISAFYATCALASLALFVWQFPSTSSSPILATDCGSAAVFAKQAGAAGMVLTGIVWYTLKGAADRGRLAASTFRQLNLAMAVVAALKLWACWQLAVAGVPLNAHLWKVVIGIGLLTMAVCDYQFFFARKEISPS